MDLKSLFYALCSLCSLTASCSTTEAPTYFLDGTTLELQCDAFLCVFDYGHEPTFMLPGSCSGVPVSVEDYFRYPDSWMYSEAFRSRYGDEYARPKPAFQGYVPKGTILKVVAIKRKWSSLAGPYVRVWVVIEDPAYANVTAELGGLIYNKMGTEDPDPLPEERLLKIVPCPP